MKINLEFKVKTYSNLEFSESDVKSHLIEYLSGLLRFDSHSYNGLPDFYVNINDETGGGVMFEIESINDQNINEVV